MPLTMAPSGTVTTVKKIHGKDETRRFLESLGFVEGGKVTVVSEMGGNLIVNIKDARIALSNYGLTGLERRKESMSTLRNAKIGQTVTVTRLNGEGALRRRIMDMGITKGTPIYVRKVAPLGDPVEVTVRGYELSIRKGDAESIEVQ